MDIGPIWRAMLKNKSGFVLIALQFRSLVAAGAGAGIASDPVARALGVVTRVDEHAGRKRHDQVAVRDAPVEERVFRSRFFICMSVERIAREVGKVLDVVERDFPRIGAQGVADLQLFERLAERMHAGIVFVRAAGPAIANRRQGLW